MVKMPCSIYVQELLILRQGYKTKEQGTISEGWR